MNYKKFGVQYNDAVETIAADLMIGLENLLHLKHFEKELDIIKQTKIFIDSIPRGLSNSEKRKVLSTSQLRLELKKKRAVKKRKSS